jgi:DNA-binding NtrC family response regulator
MEKGKKQILVIEDDEEMKCLLADFLRDEGFEARAVEKGFYALKEILIERFDLIITDIRMPTFSGLDLLPEFKKHQPKTPVIVITAFGGEAVHLKALSKGADAYLEKPVELHHLRKLIDEMISEKSHRR